MAKVLDGLDLAAQKITSLADGSAPSDAATYGQLINLIHGLDYKNGVRVTTTGNITVSAPGTTIDGVALNNGDRVLLKNQTNGAENGIYVFNGSASPLTRPADAVDGELSQGATVVVSEGTNKGNTSATSAPTQWTLSTPDPITVGTTAQTWNASGGASLAYVNGNGLSLVGTTFAVKLPASGVVGLVADGTGLYIDVNVVVRKYSQNIGDGAATSIAVTHNLGTRDVTVGVQDNTDHSMVIPSWVATDVNTVTLTFGTAPTSGQYRVTVHG